MYVVLGLCLLVFSVLVQKVSSLQCYSCLTGCGDHFNAEVVSKVDCTGSCATSVINGRTVRSCIPSVKKNGCQEVGGVNVCFCGQELCNGASESESQGGFCGPRKPVVNICTDQAIAMANSVFIDIISAPKSQQTFCKCILSPFQYETRLSFAMYGHRYPKGMQLKINDIVLKETVNGSVDIVDETPVYYYAAENNGVDGICVNVYTANKSNFNISCIDSSKSTTDQLTSSATSRKYTSAGISTSSGKFTTASTWSSSENTGSSGKFTTVSTWSSSENTASAGEFATVSTGSSSENTASSGRFATVSTRSSSENTASSGKFATVSTRSSSENTASSGKFATVSTRSSSENTALSGKLATVSTWSSSENITESKSHIGPDQGNGQANVITIVVPTVICALLILALSVILLVYVKGRRLAKETGHHEQELYPNNALSEPVTEQGHGQQNIASGEECGLNFSVHQYESLSMYVSDNLAGEMYQQLEADKNDEYQEIHDVQNISENQDRHFTKETVFQESKGQENNSNETYYTDAISQGEEYDDIV